MPRQVVTVLDARVLHCSKGPISGSVFDHLFAYYDPTAAIETVHI